MSSPAKQVVFLAGVTGRTGSSIARALVKQPHQFKLKALVRPSSADKPIIQELLGKNVGVEIIHGDIVKDNPETLESHLKDVDIIIVATMPLEENQQKNLLLAAKSVGVKRVIPSDFGPSAPPGVMKYYDSKLKTRQFIIDNNIPYTFIQVGWWAHLLLPDPHSSKGSYYDGVYGKQFHGSGKVKIAYTALERVGDFVARIISDPRTLNQTVQTWDGEATLEEVWDIGSKITGENFDDYRRLSEEHINAVITNSQDILDTTFFEYSRSVFVRGDNTVVNAIGLGALDARELYPDYFPAALEDVAKEFYNK